jgi:branched-chain amino acid transport system permease protein
MSKGAPAGIQGIGVVDGARVALQAAGLVLVLRSNRIINFAQIQIGALAAVVFYELVKHSEFVNLAQQACGPCFGAVSPDQAYNQAHPAAYAASLAANGFGGWLQANFWLSLVLCLALAPLVAYGISVLVIRRFDNAPRLIATISTLALAQMLSGITAAAPGFFTERIDEVPKPLYLPVGDIQIHLSSNPSVFFHLGEIATVVAAAIVFVGLAAFLRFSRAGIAVRAAAENPARAASLGINVAAVSGIAWLIAGSLSGIAALLGVISNRSGVAPAVSGLDVGTLVPILAAVVFARLTSLPIAVAAAVGLGVVDQALVWNFGSQVPFEGLAVALIAVSLLLQRVRATRAEQEATANYLAAREARPVPRELRRLEVVRTYFLWFTVGLAAVAIGFPFVMSPEQVSLGSVILIYATVGLSLLVLTGWAGQVSLGQLAFAAVGAYVCALLRAHLGLDPILCLIAGSAAGSGLAMIVGIPALRLRGMHLAISTLAFALATSVLLLNPSYLGRYLPERLERPFYLGFDLNDDRAFYYVSLAFLVPVIAAVIGLRRSRTARALIAARDNPDAAQSFGINLFRARLAAFAFSGFLAAFAGGLYAFQQHGVSTTAFSPERSVSVFMMVVIGGLGSIAGPLLGSLYWGLLLLFADPTLQLLGSGAVTLLVLMLAQGGLGSLAYRVRDAILRRVAVQHRVTVPSLLSEMRGEGGDARVVLAPKMRTAEGSGYTPSRYRLNDQWARFKEVKREDGVHV